MNVSEGGRANGSGGTGAPGDALPRSEAYELGLLLRTLRLRRNWSQDDLARASSLSVRVIQRAEMGEATTPEERRAVARGFGLSDLETFNRRLDTPSQAEIARAYEKLAGEHVTLPIVATKHGRELARLAISHPMDVCLAGTPLDEAATSQFEALVAAVREYREMADLYDAFERRVQVGRLQSRLDALAALGVSLCCAVRPVALWLESAKSAQPWLTSVLYLLAFDGACPTKLDL